MSSVTLTLLSSENLTRAFLRTPGLLNLTMDCRVKPGNDD
jgi:hypothetical protein